MVEDIGLEGRVALLEPFIKWTLEIGRFRGFIKEFIYFSEISDFDQIGFFQQLEEEVIPLVDSEDALIRRYNSLGLGMQYKTSETWDFVEEAQRRVEGRSSKMSVSDYLEKLNPVVSKPEDRVTDAEFYGAMVISVFEQIGYEVPYVLPETKRTEEQSNAGADYESGLEILKAIGQLRVSFYKDLLGFRDKFVAATSALRGHLGSKGHSMAQAILYDTLNVIRMYEERIMPDSFQELLSQYPVGKQLFNDTIKLRLPAPDRRGG